MYIFLIFLGYPTLAVKQSIQYNLYLKTFPIHNNRRIKKIIDMLFIKYINMRVFNLSYLPFYNRFNILLIIFKNRQTKTILQFFYPLATCEGG
jgi:hypothetical protein